MKKMLSTVAALGIVAGFATTASAVDLKIKGSYTLDGVWYDHGNGSGVDLVKPAVGEQSNDDYYTHSFYIQPTLKVNDKISMHMDIWLADYNMFSDTDDLNTTDGGNIEVHKLFMKYMSPVGQIRVGRHLANPFGTSFLDTEKHQDRIMWWPSFLAGGGIKTLLFTAKMREVDGVTGDDNSSDRDYYEARLYHNASMGKSIAALSLFDFNDTNTMAGVAYDKVDKFRFKAAGDYTFNNIYLQAELCYDFGTIERTGGGADVDISTIGFMADVGIKAGKLDVGSMFIYASGDDNGATDDELSATMTAGQGGTGLGENFEPYYILTGRHTGLFNPYVNDRIGSTAPASVYKTAANSGILSLGFHADYQVSSQLNLHSAIGYALAESEPATYLDDEYGVELNLGMDYKLLDNLTYSIHAGYLMTGDFFKGASAATEVEDIMLLSHHLNMTF